MSRVRIITLSIAVGITGLIAACAETPVEPDLKTTSEGPVLGPDQPPIFADLLTRGMAIALQQDELRQQLLHDLRKDAKRLRYLIEAFSSVYPQSKVTVSVSRLRKLQGVLGGHQDIFVHMVALRDLASDLSRNGASKATVEAIGHLATALSSEGAGHRDRFAAAFADYDSAKNRSVAKSLFRARRAT